ncbi:hypothetical protein ACP70R_035001 [Stipagrostis hirtigluma subsp. patula]
MKTTTMARAVFLLLSSFLVAAARFREDSCHPDDQAALLAVKAALSNPGRLDYWASDDSCCGWEEVDCDEFTGRVVSLSVTGDHTVTGTIPDAVAGLVHLVSLELRYLSALYGPIPPAIGTLSNLSRLTISWTAVSGPVPPFLADLAALTDVNLSQNRLTGTLPPSLFSRAPPGEEIRLTLRHNDLYGGVPAEWSAVRFHTIDLSGNAFTGDASPLFGAAKPLGLVDLSRNDFSFNFSGVELPEKLYSMDVSHNVIYGGIPAQVASLTDLDTFDVSYNQLCGEVPGSLASFDVGMFEHNRCLCGAPLLPCTSTVE